MGAKHVCVVALAILSWAYLCCSKPPDTIVPMLCSTYGPIAAGPAINHTIPAIGQDAITLANDTDSKRASHWLGDRMKYLNAGVRQRSAEKYAKVSTRSNFTKGPGTVYSHSLQYICHEVTSSGVTIRMNITKCATSDDCDYPDPSTSTSSSGTSSSSSA